MRQGIYVIILLALCCLVSKGTHAQQEGKCLIQGTVTDEKGQPIAAVTVALRKQAGALLVRETASDSNGHFTIECTEKGTYVLQFTGVSYATFISQPIAIDVNRTTFPIGTIVLQSATKEMKNVVVTAQRPLLEQKMGKLVVNVEGSVTANGSTALELLEKSPGVTVDRDGNISMQGKSGVQVLIDGRPTYLSNADLANLLKNMSGNDISSIELITTPSAKYDASGNGGVINIKTKKNRNLGFNGSVNAGYGNGKYGKLNSGTTFNYRSNKFNLFGNYSYQYNKRYEKLRIERTSISSIAATAFDQSSFEIDKIYSQNVKVGADYNLGKRTVFGVLFNGILNREKQALNGLTKISNTSSVDSSLVAINYDEKRVNNFSYNANLKHAFDSAGQELTVDLDYGRFDSRGNNTYENNFLDKAGMVYKPTQFFRSATPSDIQIRSFKADYVYPVNKTMRLEMGAKASHVVTDNTMVFEKRNGIAWENDLSRSNSFSYDEKIIAGYINASYQLKKLQYQWGMRLEQTYSKGISPTTNREVERKYLDYFPSFQVNYALSPLHNLGLSYSKRIQRPNYESLNPFVFFLDQFGYSVGNPYLNPQYSHGVELTYVLKGRYIAQAAASKTKDIMAEVLLPDSVNKAIYESYENLNEQRVYRLTLNAPLTISKWWRSNINVNGLHMGFQSDDLKGKKVDAGQFLMLINTNNSFQFGKGFAGEVIGRYTSSMIFNTFRVKPIYTVDIGLSKAVFNKKGTVKIAAVDAFNTRDQKVSSVYPGFDYRLYQKVESRVVRVSFLYRFGNNNVKAERKRSTGLESEQNRLQSNAQ